MNQGRGNMCRAMNQGLGIGAFYSLYAGSSIHRPHPNLNLVESVYP